MKIVSLFSFLYLLISSCCQDATYNCKCDTSAVAANDSILKSEETVKGLPKFFKRFNQKPLTEQPGESYRLSTMHSFNKYYQVYTLTKSQTGGDFTIQEFLCTQAYSRDCKLVNEHHSKISGSQWKSFKNTINNECFWTLPIFDPDTSHYLDGGEWNIEGFQPDRMNCSNLNYIITLRKFPSGSSDRFYNVYKALMKLVDKKQIHETE